MINTVFSLVPRPSQLFIKKWDIEKLGGPGGGAIIIMVCAFVILSCLGICQRQHCAYYRHLADNREKIREEIIAFFGKKIAKKFPNASCESRQPICNWLVCTLYLDHFGEGMWFQVSSICHPIV